MNLVIEYDISQRRGGMSATARQIGLAGHGLDQDAALASLRRTVAAWITGLAMAGQLDAALARCDIRCENAESEGLDIDLRMTA